LKKSASSKEVRHWKESEKVKQARNNLLNRMDKDNSNSPHLTYDQAEISFSKIYERMNKWESDPIVQKWLEYEENTKDNMIEHNGITENYDNELFYEEFIDQEDNVEDNISINSEDRKENTENTDSENDEKISSNKDDSKSWVICLLLVTEVIEEENDEGMIPLMRSVKHKLSLKELQYQIED
ncbi:10731_t:CDS:2, partial [Funneliformis caledonium]